MTEDVVRSRERSVRFFISNIFEMAWIHYITSFKRQKKVYFVTSYLDSVHFYVLVLECSEKKLPFDSPPDIETQPGFQIGKRFLAGMPHPLQVLHGNHS